MASVTWRRFAGPLAGSALLCSAAFAEACAQVPAARPAGPCGNAISVLNAGRAYDGFDKLNGGGDKRLRFRLAGNEPCPSGQCQAEGKALTTIEGNAERKPDAAAPGTPGDAERGAVGDGEGEAKAETRVATTVEIVAASAAAERVIARVDLKGRSVTYCVYDLSRVEVRRDPHRAGCPRSYLRNFLAIRLVDRDGPFARRDVDIQYLYRPDAAAVSLDQCTSPAILDGMFRRRVWTVPLADGAAAYIGETDFPRDRRTPVSADAPFAIDVSGARPQ